MKVNEAIIWGPDSSISYSKRVKEEAEDILDRSGEVWPTDHKALLVTFEW